MSNELDERRRAERKLLLLIEAMERALDEGRQSDASRLHGEGLFLRPMVGLQMLLRFGAASARVLALEGFPEEALGGLEELMDEARKHKFQVELDFLQMSAAKIRANRTPSR